MIKCKNCECSPLKKTLHRTEPKGQINAGWMCLDCIKIQHLELSKNIIGDGNDVLNVVEDACGIKKTT